MTFPDKKYAAVGDLADDYFGRYTHAAGSVDRARLAEAAAMLEAAYERGEELGGGK